MNSLERLFRQAVYKTLDNRGRIGLLGRADGTVTFTDDLGVNYRNKVWVRIVSRASVTEVVAENRAVPLQPNLPVRVAEVNGAMMVIGVETRAANIFTGGYLSEVPEHAWTHGRYGPDPLYIAGLQFLPLACVPTDPVSYQVQVLEGWFRYGNILNVWEQAASSSLSSYVPTNTGQQHFVIISLNRETNALAITDGITKNTPYATEAPFTISEILAVVETLSIEHYPIAAIRFYFGQSAIRPPDIFKDLRLWGGEVLTQYYTSLIVSDSATATDTATLRISNLILSVQDNIEASDDATVSIP